MKTEALKREGTFVVQEGDNKLLERLFHDPGLFWVPSQCMVIECAERERILHCLLS